jgi:hypothetical protein
MLLCVSPATADVVVTHRSGALVVTSAALGAEPNARASVVIEHFADANRNGLRIRQVGLGDPAIRTSDSLCTENPLFNDVVCGIGLPSRIEIVTSDADDRVAVGGSNVGCEPTTGMPTSVNLAGGNDVLSFVFCRNATGSPERLAPIVTAAGGDGNDVLQGNHFADVLNGGAGNDRLEGNGGDDGLFGGVGNDDIFGGFGNDDFQGNAGADLIDGQQGVDRLTYGVQAPVTVTLDGVANDGVAGEGDNVRSIEILEGGDGGDTLTGSAGNETITGGLGNDVITGGGGTDTLHGTGGDDLIDARDAVKDTVHCGFGQDQAILDLVDVVAVRLAPLEPRDLLCERVERFAVDDGPPARATGRSVRIARDGSLAVTVACPHDARIACRGTLSLRDARRPQRVLASGRYDVRRGRSAAVRLGLAAADAARLRARRTVVAVTREPGVSKKGPRSAMQTLGVR